MHRNTVTNARSSPRRSTSAQAQRLQPTRLVSRAWKRFGLSPVAQTLPLRMAIDDDLPTDDRAVWTVVDQHCGQLALARG